MSDPSSGCSSTTPKGQVEPRAAAPCDGQTGPQRALTVTAAVTVGGESAGDRLLPADVGIFAPLILPGTFGRAEKEQAAALIVRLHHHRGDQDWQPFRLPEFADLLKNDMGARSQAVGAGPFFRPDFGALVAEGHIEGLMDGDPSSSGRVTQSFLDAIAGSRCDRRTAATP